MLSAIWRMSSYLMTCRNKKKLNFMNKITPPYKKLKEIIIGKYNDRMEFRK
jgi:hypothetical protein